MLPVESIARRLDAVSQLLPSLSRMLRSLQEKELELLFKSNELDYATVADLESERMIVEMVEEYFPEDRILAEEGGDRGGTGPFVWVIDPVDGTVNYSHGLPLYTVSVGLALEREPVGGVVFLPALGDLYRAIQGEGATKNGKPLRASQREPLSRGLVVTGFPYNRREHLDLLAEGVRAVLEKARGIRRTGCASLDLCWLAEGRFDAFYELNLKPWDTCAGTIIAREAGAVVSDFRGDPYDPFQCNTLAASNPRIHEEFLRLLSLFPEEGI